MTWVSTFYANGAHVKEHHRTNNVCPVGNSIPAEDRLFGTGWLPLCQFCARM